MTPHRFVSMASVCLLTSSLALAATPPTPAPAAGPVAPEAMTGLVFDGLTPEQKALAVSILNEIGKSVIDLVKQGKSHDEIVKSVLMPPSKFVAFALTPGDSPSIGPKNAKVTILHYTDYQ